MNDWEVAQRKVALLIGGKVTPGSGNGHQKGDVVREDTMVEVKQTSKKSLSVRKFWLLKLLREAKKAKTSTVIFAVFFELRGYAYVLQTVAGHTYDTDWKSVSLKEDNLPEKIYSGPHHQWVLTPWTTIKDQQ
jgi:hypothetical protein